MEDERRKIVEQKSNRKDFEFTVASAPHPLVPEGTYQVSFLKAEKVPYFSVTKLYIWMCICDGAYTGTKLFKAYNYYKPLPTGSSLFKDLVLLCGRRVFKNARLSVDLFKNKVIAVRVRTVRMDQKQVPLQEFQSYSVISSIVEVVAGAQGIALWVYLSAIIAT